MGPNCILSRAGEKVGQLEQGRGWPGPRPWREAPLSLKCDKVQAGEEERKKEKE